MSLKKNNYIHNIRAKQKRRYYIIIFGRIENEKEKQIP